MSDDDASTEDLIGFEDLVDGTSGHSTVVKESGVRSPWPSLESTNSVGCPGRHGAAADTRKE